MIVKMTILRLLGSSDDKEKIGVARPEGPHLLEKKKNGKVVAYVMGWRTYRWNRPIWVPKDIIHTMDGSQKVWVPKT